MSTKYYKEESSSVRQRDAERLWAGLVEFNTTRSRLFTTQKPVRTPEMRPLGKESGSFKVQQS